MSRLNDLLRQISVTNPQLARDLQRETDALADRRAFGLNFERHVPEAVELPGRPVRKNDKVRILPERGQPPTKENESLYRVERTYIDDGERWADVVAVNDPEEAWSVTVDDLVVVAEFRDPIYPGLVSTGRLEQGPDKAFHTVMNAENYHALQALLLTHRGKIDCIYIDPPYNTGASDWIYNDSYVGSDDYYRHSKWLAFIERRLVLAKDLLKPSGVFIVAIGDDEHHRLRMLMDQVLGPQNFIMNVTWQGGVSALAKHHGGGADYMLMYGVDASLVPKLRDPKPFAPEMLELVRTALQDGMTRDEAQAELRAFLKSKKPDIAPGLAIFNKVDEDGEIYLEGDLGNSLPRPNLRYVITNPETGRTYQPPANGWEVGREKMNELLENGRIIFGNRNVPARKKLLREHMDQLPSPTFYKDRRAGSQRLRKMLGGDRFPNSKDPEVLARWIRMVTPPDGIVLDFFAGSGSTAEAVMRLNEQDHSRRLSITVTNNEMSEKLAKKLRARGLRPGDEEWELGGVFEYVTKPRIEAVVTGVRTDGTECGKPMTENVEFFKLTYESAMRVSSNREFAKIAAFLWMRAGSRGPRIDDISSGWEVTEAYGVIADLDLSESFFNAVGVEQELTHVFVVTDEDRLFEATVRRLPEHVEAIRLYSSYLRNFEIEAGRVN